METSGRRTTDSLIEHLRTEPQRFNFFQAVRVLRRWNAHASTTDTNHKRPEELIRFSAEATLSFSSSQITQVDVARSDPSDPASTIEKVTLHVSFFGLVGASGVLPYHYTVDSIRALRARQGAIVDFFNVFHTRLLHYFYLAWEKHQVALQFEDARRADRDVADPFSHMLLSLMGLSTHGHDNRSSVGRDAHLRYAAFFAQHRRNATSLQQMLADYFGVPFKVCQFQFQRLAIPIDDRSQFPIRDELRTYNNQLGRNVVLGKSVWDCSGKFRLRVGPLDFGQYVQFIRDGEDFGSASYLARLYVRSEFTFDIQPILKKEQIPEWKVTSDRPSIHRLGRTVWLKSRESDEDFEKAFYEAADGIR